jgi:hypothetical protein
MLYNTLLSYFDKVALLVSLFFFFFFREMLRTTLLSHFTDVTLSIIPLLQKNLKTD